MRYGGIDAKDLRNLVTDLARKTWNKLTNIQKERYLEGTATGDGLDDVSLDPAGEAAVQEGIMNQGIDLSLIHI